MKRIKKEYYDKLMVAKLSRNTKLYEELYAKYKDVMYEEIVTSYGDIEYINNLLENGLEDHGAGIYAGVVEGQMYEYDFSDKSVTLSINLIHNYVFLAEYKRVWFFTDYVKNAYLYADYETGEILDFVGPEKLKDKLMKEFDYKGAMGYILKFSGAKSLEELFKYYLE